MIPVATANRNTFNPGSLLTKRFATTIVINSMPVLFFARRHCFFNIWFSFFCDLRKRKFSVTWSHDFLTVVQRLLDSGDICGNFRNNKTQLESQTGSDLSRWWRILHRHICCVVKNTPVKSRAECSVLKLRIRPFGSISWRGCFHVTPTWPHTPAIRWRRGTNPVAVERVTNNMGLALRLVLVNLTWPCLSRYWGQTFPVTRHRVLRIYKYSAKGRRTCSNIIKEVVLAWFIQSVVSETTFELNTMVALFFAVVFFRRKSS